MTIWVHSPEGEVQGSPPPRASLPSARAGKLVVGLFDNRKANAARLLEAIGRSLASGLGAELRRYSKPNASHAAEAALLDRMAAEVGLVVAASSD